ncbi:MAG: virulence factor SrfB [Muribaculaceae bacterium]|nr:virulence factor SrfB [Muribaculaceae bacterium]
MKAISLIYNSGIQFFELEDRLVIDTSSTERILDPLYFYEQDENGKIKLEVAYYFPGSKRCLRRVDLIEGGYLHPLTNQMMEEDDITEAMNWLDPQSLIRINKLTEKVGELKRPGLDQLENQWLPIPYFERNLDGGSNAPSNWCRIKLMRLESESTETKRVYKVLLSFDTNERPGFDMEAPYFLGEPFRTYSMCGLSGELIGEMPRQQQEAVLNRLVPLKAFDFCNTEGQPWINRYLKEIFHCADQAGLPHNGRLKHLAYYAYFISYLFRAGILPEVKLYNDEGLKSIDTNLILDIGNSRTFGLIAEDPIDSSFSKAETVKIRNLETGQVYKEPFDMRLCFKKEDFGIETVDGAFRWPSVVRLGKEALANIYSVNRNFDESVQYDTSYSSPKRFLWDKDAYAFQWKYITNREDDLGPLRAIDYDGLMQQFHNDGRFASNPQEMGDKSCYSRSSLMTFCFLEILLQVRMQINSYEFRKSNGDEHRKREIKRVILTCPTAMTKDEQITLRQCMEDATIVLKRYYSKTFNRPYDRNLDSDKITIIPSIRDLSYKESEYNLRSSWSYDEATCCQMVYMYSELRRYLGNSGEFFRTYGRLRNDEEKPSLNIATLDIGAGTTDIMICKYNEKARSIQPEPLFWESFKLAGDDLVKRVIVDVMLDAPHSEYPNASGIITAKLQSMGVTDIAQRMNFFFGHNAAMKVVNKRMRKEFLIQVLQPIASLLLEKLRQGQDEHNINFEDIFPDSRPSKSLMDFFHQQMGFRFEDLVIRFSPKFLNEIIRRVFEPSMRKWAAIFHAYQCDVVLMSGRPCSLPQMRSQMQRLYPVSPDRLISMNTYRVGSWYPGSSTIGHFKDNKSMVAVGALIAYLAENGKLPEFRLSTDLLKSGVLPTTDFMGFINTHTGSLESFLSPQQNESDKEVTVFPVSIGGKQLDIDGYPSCMMYLLEMNSKAIKDLAIKRLLKKNPTIREKNISADMLSNEIEKIVFDIRMSSPLIVHFERDYQEDKEQLTITSIIDSNGNDLAVDMLRLKLQTWSEESTNWLDTGIFKLRIGK